jgi:hypothetical protein
MKTLLSSLLAFLIYFNAYAGGLPCLTYNISGTVTNATCVGLNNGSIKITDVGSVGGAFQTSTKPLLISEIFSNPNGNDSPFEFVELVATKNIDFSVTPYTVIFNNNGSAGANGWVQGGQITYAFSITTGTVTAGQVVYVGGSSMVATGTQLRVLNTSLGGDGGIGAFAGRHVLALPHQLRCDEVGVEFEAGDCRQPGPVRGQPSIGLFRLARSARGRLFIARLATPSLDG